MQDSKGPTADRQPETRLKQLKRLPPNTVVPHVASHLDALVLHALQLESTIAAWPGDSAAPSQRAVHILQILQPSEPEGIVNPAAPKSQVQRSPTAWAKSEEEPEGLGFRV